MFLIDTNVISEWRKGTRCDANVASWFASIDADDLYLSMPALGEIGKGIEGLRSRDPLQARALDTWLARVDKAFGDRILPIDGEVADEWGRLNAIRPISVVDGLLAATAKIHQLTLVTRNESDVAGLGATVLNPFHPIQ
jgi:predicted nucleic acid-binding protein